MSEGQIICSNCDYENEVNLNINYKEQINLEKDNAFINIVGYNGEFNNSRNDMDVNKEIIRKQQPLLKVASILALIASVAMIVVTVVTLFVNMQLGTLTSLDLIKIIVSMIMIADALFISNYNIGKNSFFDNKVIFIVLLCINFLAGLSMRIYMVIFILSLIGFVISNKNNKVY